MMRTKIATRTGKIKYTKEGLDDYIADGVLFDIDVGHIPCKIGYMSDRDIYTAEPILKPVHIFIQQDGVTPEGNHYVKQTIDIYHDVTDIYCEEEK